MRLPSLKTLSRVSEKLLCMEYEKKKFTILHIAFFFIERSPMYDRKKVSKIFFRWTTEHTRRS